MAIKSFKNRIEVFWIKKTFCLWAKASAPTWEFLVYLDSFHVPLSQFLETNYIHIDIIDKYKINLKLYIHIYTCQFIYIYICTYQFIYVYTHTHIYIHTHFFLYLFTLTFYHLNDFSNSEDNLGNLSLNLK